MSLYGQPELAAGDIEALIAALEMEYIQTCEFTSAAPPPADACTGEGGRADADQDASR